MSADSENARPKLAIIAGGGSAPRHLIETCRRLGRDVFVVCLEGQADTDLAKDAPHAWLPLGAGTRLKQIVEEQQLKEAVMIGSVKRPSIFELKPDLLALKVVMKAGINRAGDDTLLRGIGKAIEQETGMRVIGVQDVFADLLMPEGQLGRHAPNEEALSDIARGIEAAQALGRLDIGQAAVVQQGIVLVVEAAEGTDALILRCAGLRREGPGGVLVKTAKPQQDNRFDLPTIGPDTITVAAKAGLRGVALEAGRSLLIEREKTIALANDAGLFILGIVPAKEKPDA